ncbi:hypothetical protein [Streptomyces olivaceiscleroticus]|uniref:Uncharacterized protein n=1 Tax=Streptomyces olivaceiscleroticus TaxID=68245 RepID=A0ABN1BM44_9ACTN
MTDTDRWPNAFTWLQHLDQDDRAELVNDLRNALGTDDPETALNQFNAEAHAWKATAEVLADPELHHALVDKEPPGGGW